LLELGPSRSLRCVGKTYEIDVLLSPEDYEWAISRGNWFITHGANPAAKRYAVRSEDGRLIWLHIEVLKRSFKLPPSSLHVIGDHWNGDSFDNRRPNLRWATHGMNARNIYGFASRQGELALDL
jgi:hypothetical protein